MNGAGVLIRRVLAHAVRPILALGPPGSGRIVRAIGADDDRVWRSAPRGLTRLRWGAGVVELDRTERYERLAWLHSRYHELPLLLLMRALLRPGDTFVDVGANLGLVSLHAAKTVGRGGRVVAFEPNPAVRERLEQHVRRSRADVVVDGRALGSSRGEFRLSVIGTNTGSGTLGAVPEHLRPQVRSTYRVEVVTGDEAASLWSGSPQDSRLFIKVDAEGFETRVLEGLKGVLLSRRPLIVTEVNPFALRMNGSGPRLLTHFMRELGYQGFELESRRRGAWRVEPTLGPMRPPRRPGLRDVVWTHAECPMHQEVERLLLPGARAVGCRVTPDVAQEAATSSSPAPTPAP